LESNSLFLILFLEAITLCLIMVYRFISARWSSATNKSLFVTIGTISPQRLIEAFRRSLPPLLSTQGYCRQLLALKASPFPSWELEFLFQTHSFFWFSNSCPYHSQGLGHVRHFSAKTHLSNSTSSCSCLSARAKKREGCAGDITTH
jgi:hypothetical protein